MPFNDHNSDLAPVFDELRRKLLDLTGRNRLINFTHTAGKSLQFVEGDPSTIYKKLVESGNKTGISVRGLPEPAPRFWVERNGRAQRPEAKEWAKDRGIPTSYTIESTESSDEASPSETRRPHLRALMYEEELAIHCRKLEREANLAIEETGANMLFLVLGFLEFPEQLNSTKTYTAPLISVPVVFSRKNSSGTQSFSLHFTGEDISENLSLKEKLLNDFGLTLPPLPEDEIDVEEYFRKVQTAIKNRPRFALKRWVSLCLLSFSNMLLVRDLDANNWPTENGNNLLIDHPIVRELLEGRIDDDGDEGFPPLQDHSVEEGPGANIPLIFDADSSQHTALIDVLVGRKNMVIEGPPGTGKSQTITNLIAAALSQGKKVLFVAEKLAALEVVKNRLAMAGLDPFVLELHSNKTSKKRVLEEIDRRRNFSPLSADNLHNLLQLFETKRQDLKKYSNLINSATNNSLGMTLHQVMWRLERTRQGLEGKESLLSRVSTDGITITSIKEFNERMNSLSILGQAYKAVGGFDESRPFWGFYPDLLVQGDDANIAELFTSAEPWAQALLDNTNSLAELLDHDLSGFSSESCLQQIKELTRLLEAANPQLPLHLIPQMFAEDSGESASKVLADFAGQVDTFNQLSPVINTGLKDESAVTSGTTRQLEALRTLAAGLGATLGRSSELKTLQKRLTDNIDKLSAAVSSLAASLARLGIPHDDSRQHLSHLNAFADLILNAPEQHMHLQSTRLASAGAVKAIGDLQQLQLEWTGLEASLGQSLYTDTLPSEEDIKKAVLTLREGDAWYRIFQSKWRAAVSVHKSLQRTKVRVPGRERLQQLEQVANMLTLKQRWKDSPVWSTYLELQAPSHAMDLGGYMAVAQWSADFKKLADGIPSTTIDFEDYASDRFRALRREFIGVNSDIVAAKDALSNIDSCLPSLMNQLHSDSIDKTIEWSQSFVTSLNACIEWLELHAQDHANVDEVISACSASLERKSLKRAIDSNKHITSLLGTLYRGISTDCSSALSALAFGKSIAGYNFLPQIKKKLLQSNPVEAAESACTLFLKIREGLAEIDKLANALRRFGKFSLEEWARELPDRNFALFVKGVHKAVREAVLHKETLVQWSSYCARRGQIIRDDLLPFVALLERKQIPFDKIHEAYVYCVLSSILRDAFRQHPELQRFSGLELNQLREEFKRLDREIIKLRGRAVADECVKSANAPKGRSGSRVSDLTQMELLKYLIPQQRPRVPVRKILKAAGQAVQELKPCFMMGPQAVAQYLDPRSMKFDLVIMDEASQLKPEEAIGAVARGTQLVVVGDPKQLPPTSFFSRSLADSEEFEEHSTTTDSESILDVCVSRFKHSRQLLWHYRSQHHSLIAFSNHFFYEGKLLIFPSPYGQGRHLGLSAIHLTDAIYEHQKNDEEASRVVDAVMEHITTRPKDSLGVVTLNSKQRDLISELLEARIRTTDEADTFRAYWADKGEPLFVKNLETVQGDERDAIIISTTFGKPRGAKVARQNFGPISRDGGWRRLNVLFTRAKKSITVVTSLRPGDIILDGRTPKGTKALRDYLEYIQTGLLPSAAPTGREPDSDFEIAVIKKLEERGYSVTPQLGVAGYRIDIAVKHPDGGDTYLAAIECDGATYHSAQSVRDRDRIRQEILEALGWRGRIWRIWSTDWFRDPRKEMDNLVSFLKDIEKSWKPEHKTGKAWVEEGAHAWHSTPPADQMPADSAGSIPMSDGAEPNDVSETEVVAVESLLIDSEYELEVEVGDVVHYIDLESSPTTVVKKRITAGQPDPAINLINKDGLLAQALLGAVVGDMVPAQQGGKWHTLKIVKIEKHVDHLGNKDE